MVDKTYAKDFGTDQRRQRQEAQNLREARAPHKLSWVDATDDEMGEDRPRKDLRDKDLSSAGRLARCQLHLIRD